MLLYTFWTNIYNTAKAMFYDGSTSGLTAKNVQDAIDEIVASSSNKPFVTPSLTDPATNSITQAMMDDNSGVVILLTGAGNDQTLPAPTDTTAGNTKFTVINDDASTNSINIIGGSTSVLDPGKKIEAIWEGTAYVFSEAEGIFLDDGTDVKMQNSTRNFNVQSGKFKAGSNTSIYESSGDTYTENTSPTKSIHKKIGDALGATSSKVINSLNQVLHNVISNGTVEDGIPNYSYVEELKNYAGETMVKHNTVGRSRYGLQLDIGRLTPGIGLLDVSPETPGTNAFTRPFPVLTNAEILALKDVKEGATAYDTDNKVVLGYDGTSWRVMQGHNYVYLENFERDFPIVGSDFDSDIKTIYDGGQKAFSITREIKMNSQSQLVNILDLTTTQKVAIATDNTTTFRNIRFIYLGTGDFLTGLDTGVVRIDGCQFITPLSTGKAINIKTTNPINALIMNETVFAQCNQTARFEGYTVANNVNQFIQCNNGFEFHNCYNGTSLTAISGQANNNAPGMKMLSFSGTISSIILNTIQGVPSGANEYIFNFDKDLITESILIGNSPAILTAAGVSEDNIYYPGSLTEKDPVMTVSGSTIKATTTSLESSVYAGILTTQILAANTPFEINLESTLEKEISERCVAEDECTFDFTTNKVTSYSKLQAGAFQHTLNSISITSSNIAFNDNGASVDTIVKADGGFLVAGFQVGDQLTVTGSASNDGVYNIIGVTDTILTLVYTDTLATEGVGASVTITKQDEIELVAYTPRAYTAAPSTFAFVAGTPATITDSANGFLTSGIKRYDQLVITGTATNNKTVTVALVTAGSITLRAGDTLINEGAGAASVTLTVRHTGVIPTGLTARKYFVIYDAASTFFLSLTRGGSIVNFTDNGTGILWYKHGTGRNTSNRYFYTGIAGVTENFSCNIDSNGTSGVTDPVGLILYKIGKDGSITEHVVGTGSNISSSQKGTASVISLVRTSKNEGVEPRMVNQANSNNVNCRTENLIITI